MMSSPVQTASNYFQSTQYNWSGKYDEKTGKKIPGNIPECIVRGLFHPLQESKTTESSFSFSMINLEILPGKKLNPARFKTIRNVATVTSGTGVYRIHGETGIQEFKIGPDDTITIPPQTQYSFENISTAGLKMVMVSDPAWFQADEEYDWDLVIYIPGAK